MKLEEYSKYRKKYEDLVELEREEEMTRHRNEIENLSGKERQSKGRAILGLKGRKQGKEFGDIIVKFVKGQELPKNEIGVGDLVMISKNEPLNEDNPTGTVIEETRYSISVAFPERPQNFVFGKDLRLDLYVNDITFQRMKEALQNFEEAKGKTAKIRSLFLGKGSPEFSEIEEPQFMNKDLDKSQKEAVINSLKAEDLFLIHGPPGTGKTTTIIEVIEQHLKKGAKVLATADSNVAVDNLVEFLSKKEKKVVRVGHPARVTKTLRKHTLDFIIEGNDKYQRAQNLREEVEGLDEEQEDHLFPSGKHRRGLSNEQIRGLAKKNKGSRGLSSSKIKSMAEWIRLQNRIGEIVEKAKKLEEKAVSEVIENAEVVLSTNSTAGSDLLKDKNFDLVVIDEATQATEPSCLIPLQNTDKLIMAGDHKQLPPTILNKKAKGLSKTLFERLLEIHGDKIKSMLEVQYRMNTKIMNFPSKHFYNSNLVAANSVANHRIDIQTGTSPVDKICNPEHIITFVDIDSHEKSRRGSTSKENEKEAEKVKKVVANLLEKGIDYKNIGVISPYDDQIDILDKMVSAENLEIKTVDGFQGREKDVIILSFVRANEKGEIGFLSDLRRLNVSITRARKKLIMVGNSNTLSHNQTYKELIKYTKKEGNYIK